jgi:GT2 family glycosyltransferase
MGVTVHPTPSAAAPRLADVGAGPAGSPGLSVAICTRDRPALLRRALQSLAAQSAPPDEILVVDNGSPDGAVRGVAAEFAGVRYVAEPVPGLDFARNRALRAATHAIVAFLDDDAIADRDWALGVRAVFTGHPAVAAGTGRIAPLALETDAQRLFEANGGLFADHGTRVRLPADAARPLRGRRVPLIAWAVSVGSGANLAVRRDAALAVGGFDEALDLGAVLPGGGDNDMVWRLLQAGHEVVYEPRAIVRHEHRREHAAAMAQIIGHQRALVALLTKAVVHTRGAGRLPVIGFLLWRLAKPGVRLARRAMGRDPLPAPVLLRMWLACVGALVAYPRARRVAGQRRHASAMATVA